MRRRVTRAGGVAVIAAALAAAGWMQVAGSTQTTAVAAGSDERGATGTGSVVPTPEQVDDPVATATVDAPGGGTLTVDVVRLERRGALAVLWLRYTIEDAAQGDELLSPYDMGANRAPDPFLVDTESLTRYGVVSAEGCCKLESDAVFNKTIDGRPLLAHYVFAAPPKDVSKVDVFVWDFTPAFRDVPVEEAGG